MPISSLALARAPKPFTDHLKGFELGAITETNPSNGVYRYTFADGTSPYTWAEVANAMIGNQYRFGINVGHVQMGNNTDASGGGSFYGQNPNYLHFNTTDPKIDSAYFTSPSTFGRLPSGRNTETTAEFASYLGGTAITQGYNYAWYFGTLAPRIQDNAPVTLNYPGRYVEINWNTVALNETTNTTFQLSYGRTAAANIKLVFQPYIYFDNLSTPDYAVYYGKPRYYNSTIAGTSLSTLRSSPPPEVSSFSYPGGRVFQWVNSNTNAQNPYLYLYKWNGASWDTVRYGHLSDGNTGAGTSQWNQYTVPNADGTSTYFYIYVYQYDGYYSAFSPAGLGSNYITV